VGVAGRGWERVGGGGQNDILQAFQPPNISRYKNIILVSVGAETQGFDMRYLGGREQNSGGTLMLSFYLTYLYL
jgi:hypothetical protein